MALRRVDRQTMKVYIYIYIRSLGPRKTRNGQLSPLPLAQQGYFISWQMIPISGVRNLKTVTESRPPAPVSSRQKFRHLFHPSILFSSKDENSTFRPSRRRSVFLGGENLSCFFRRDTQLCRRRSDVTMWPPSVIPFFTQS